MDRIKAVAQAFKNGRAKRDEIEATLRAVRGDAYADAVFAALAVLNFLSAVADVSNRGFVDPDVIKMLSTTADSAHGGCVHLLLLETRRMGVPDDDVIHDVNAFLSLVRDLDTILDKTL